eukprot:5431647-Pyramimonas_sp.AAC.1
MPVVVGAQDDVCLRPVLDVVARGALVQLAWPHGSWRAGPARTRATLAKHSSRMPGKSRHPRIPATASYATRAPAGRRGAPRRQLRQDGPNRHHAPRAPCIRAAAPTANPGVVHRVHGAEGGGHADGGRGRASTRTATGATAGLSGCRGVDGGPQ